MILEKINTPGDLKGLNLQQLKQLAGEVRQQIIDVVSKNGGHLAPSLGTVELTIALHYALDAPEDKLIWDVGHQTYAHKILTGRKNEFCTLRTYRGLSGFPKRAESQYDCFDTGHASTSISAALGMACARDLAGEKYRVAAIIGDGSLTGGLAFEGLNHAGQLKKTMLVVLNDNRMAISKRVGALGQYLTRITTAPAYTNFEKNVWDLLGALPKDMGQPTRVMFRRLRQGFKNLIVPGLTFEELGYHYEGPVDGHDLQALIKILNRIKDLSGPTMLHVLTTKGKGYAPAESNAEKFHGVGAFDPETGDSRTQSDIPSYTEVFGQTLTELARQNPKIVAITAAMPEGTGLDIFREAIPERFYDVGIAEQHALTFAAGLAVRGFRPVVAIYSTFLQRGYDQIIHDIALQKLPVALAIGRAGLVGEDGPTHHGPFDVSYLRCVPNLLLMAPKDEQELKDMLLTALKHDGPAAIRYPRGSGFGVKLKAPQELALGRAKNLREGKAGAILGLGIGATLGLQAAGLLVSQGLELEVWNARFASPLDEEAIRDILTRHQKTLTIEENVLAGGFGSAVLELANRLGLKTEIKRLGLPDSFVEAGPRPLLLEKNGLSALGIAALAEKYFKARP
ncbi:1-deoxy-D-xylulose-5-phosphate synthase [candidate division TA06 bacterium]|uniref:1-deoxy-D-xylulose-5-phosphate synthase n=1 Tax=candidate division TA06 bacterium TaxID=2250710 RepID=A0A933I8P7_UNCT6|nr:1-deoxy-D-xylulose-5-phosphate synthase [candidate division TA06 bacterium]